jgi:CRP-like cAMP-binding protein
MRDVIQTLLNYPGFTEGEYWSRLHVDADTEVLKQGEQGQSFFLLDKGMLRVLGKVEIADSKILNPGVYDVQVGDIVGELALFDDEPRSATVRALEDSELIEIKTEPMMTFLRGHPDIGFQFMEALMRIMVSRLRSSNQKVFSLLAWGLKAHQIEKEL